MVRTSRKSAIKLDQIARKETRKDSVVEALNALKLSGFKIGRRSRRIEVIVDADVLKAAGVKTGFGDDSVIVNGALAILAASDDFGRYLICQAGRLSDDFESGV